MFTLTKWIAAPAVAMGLMIAADAPSAQAQYGCYSGGGLSIGVVPYSGLGGYHSSVYRSAYRGYGGVGVAYGGVGAAYGGLGGVHYGRSRYAHRGHYDWHPTEIVPHGNHLHIQRGHYDYHRGPHHGVGHHGYGHGRGHH